jgi:hypothetical protein
MGANYSELIFPAIYDGKALCENAAGGRGKVKKYL